MPDDLTAPLRLVTGDEELLIARAVAAVTTAARAVDAGTDVRSIPAAGADLGELLELLSPSLFSERRVVVVEGAQDARTEIVEALCDYVADPIDGISLVVLHRGGPARGKPASRGRAAAPAKSAAAKTAASRRTALLDAMRAAGAVEVACPKLTRPEERVDFVRAEVHRAGGAISASAAAILLDAVGTELRELAAACEQLVFDSLGETVDEVREHQIDAATVRRYYRGRAEVTGFAVADRAVVGDVAGALETLRWALSVGVAQVLVADALADGVRTVARVSAAGRGNPYSLAGSLGLPPWKVKRAQGQARGWTEAGLTRALGIVAQVNADVKGAAADPSYALEKAIRQVAAARAG